MKLVADWRAQLNRLWSVRIGIFTALLASGDEILTTLNGGGFLTPKWYAGLALAIVVARVVQQKPTP